MFFLANQFLPERNIPVILQYTKKGKPTVTTAICTDENRWIDTRIQRDITDNLKDAAWCNFFQPEN
jgi:hypothetical protein